MGCGESKVQASTVLNNDARSLLDGETGCQRKDISPVTNRTVEVSKSPKGFGKMIANEQPLMQAGQVSTEERLKESHLILKTDGCIEALENKQNNPSDPKIEQLVKKEEGAENVVPAIRLAMRPCSLAFKLDIDLGSEDCKISQPGSHQMKWPPKKQKVVGPTLKDCHEGWNEAIAPDNHSPKSQLKGNSIKKWNMKDYQARFQRLEKRIWSPKSKNRNLLLDIADKKHIQGYSRTNTGKLKGDDNIPKDPSPRLHPNNSLHFQKQSSLREGIRENSHRTHSPIQEPQIQIRRKRSLTSLAKEAHVERNRLLMENPISFKPFRKEDSIQGNTLSNESMPQTNFKFQCSSAKTILKPNKINREFFPPSSFKKKTEVHKKSKSESDLENFEQGDSSSSLIDEFKAPVM